MTSVLDLEEEDVETPPDSSGAAVPHPLSMKIAVATNGSFERAHGCLRWLKTWAVMLSFYRERFLREPVAANAGTLVARQRQSAVLELATKAYREKRHIG